MNKSVGNLPSPKELTTAVFKMANDKSPGINRIPPEAYNLWASGDTNTVLIEMIQKYWIDEKFGPNLFHKVSLKILSKTGELSNQNKWRGITLPDISSRIISSILASRLEEHYWSFVNETQCGLLRKKGCTNANFVVKFSIQTLNKYRESVYCIFADLVKAYNTVNW